MRTRNPHRLRELCHERINRVDRENQRRDAALTAKQEARLEPVTDFEIGQAMGLYGGSFVSALGEAWYRADSDSREKLRAAFPELFTEYRELARLKRERKATT